MEDYEKMEGRLKSRGLNKNKIKNRTSNLKNIIEEFERKISSRKVLLVRKNEWVIVPRREETRNVNRK